MKKEHLLRTLPLVINNHENKNYILGCRNPIIPADIRESNRTNRRTLYTRSLPLSWNVEGKYYTFGTGGGGLISEDGWTWNGGGVRPGRGAAPDAVKIGDRYLIAYSATGGGLGGSHRGTVLTMWNKTLDPKSPDFKYTEAIAVASSEDNEDCDAIDAGLLLDPTDGRLWLSYGTYFGFIRLVELDPATGKRVEVQRAYQYRY